VVVRGVASGMDGRGTVPSAVGPVARSARSLVMVIKDVLGEAVAVVCSVGAGAGAAERGGIGGARARVG